MFDYIYDRKFPKPNEFFSYCCPITKIPLYYNYPTKYDIPFLSMEYLGPIIFQIFNPQIISKNINAKNQHLSGKAGDANKE